MNLILTKNEFLFENGISINVENVFYSVYKTKDYDKFNSIKANRNLNLRHVNAIKKSIADNNLLQANPILVNQWGQVIDGQHRLKASSELGVYVYFIVIPNLGNKEIKILNGFRSDWSLSDFLESNLNTSKSQFYNDVKRLSEKYKLSVGIINILAGIDTYELRNKFKEGEINELSKQDFKNIVIACELLFFLKNELKVKGVSSTNFARAIRKLVYIKGFDMEVFKKKLSYQSTRVVPCINLASYLKMFIDIYNYKNSKPLIY